MYFLLYLKYLSDQVLMLKILLKPFSHHPMCHRSFTGSKVITLFVLRFYLMRSFCF